MKCKQCRKKFVKKTTWQRFCSRLCKVNYLYRKNKDIINARRRAVYAENKKDVPEFGLPAKEFEMFLTS